MGTTLSLPGLSVIPYTSHVLFRGVPMRVMGIPLISCLRSMFCEPPRLCESTEPEVDSWKVLSFSDMWPVKLRSLYSLSWEYGLKKKTIWGWEMLGEETQRKERHYKKWEAKTPRAGGSQGGVWPALIPHYMHIASPTVSGSFSHCLTQVANIFALCPGFSESIWSQRVFDGILSC